jgi:hypothetical protein
MDLSVFEIFAEVSVAILGFSGIVAVIDDSNNTSPFVAARIRGLLLTSGIAAISALAPLTGLALTYCSILLIILIIASQLWGIWLMRQQAAKPSWVIFFLSLIAMLAAVIWIVYGLVSEPEMLISGYIFTVSVMLLMSGLFFVRMVLAITSVTKGT